MGTFRVAIEIGDPQGQRWETVDALVDTGASYTWLPSDLLTRLRVRPQFQREFLTADECVIERDMAETRIRLDGEERTTLVVFGDEASLSFLGAYTLEGLGLAPDPVNRRLIRVRGFAL
ncbi:MAG: aspartyl protease family protein [Dehalococcoidia bacterium]